MWEVRYELIRDWLDEQDTKTLAGIADAVEMLEQMGPNLGRPLVDTLTGSRLNNLKELRPSSSGTSEVRILFVFDPTRRAVFLVAGDKSNGKSRKNRWNGWYRKAIPLAEKRYEQYLNSLGDENGLP